MVRGVILESEILLLFCFLGETTRLRASSCSPPVTLSESASSSPRPVRSLATEGELLVSCLSLSEDGVSAPLGGRARPVPVSVVVATGDWLGAEVLMDWLRVRGLAMERGWGASLGAALSLTCGARPECPRPLRVEVEEEGDSPREFSMRLRPMWWSW